MLITLISNFDPKKPCMDQHLQTVEELRAVGLPTDGAPTNAGIGNGMRMFRLRENEILYYLSPGDKGAEVFGDKRVVRVFGCPDPVVHGFVVGWAIGMHVDTMLTAAKLNAKEWTNVEEGTPCDPPTAA